jgi:hypothetical protein
MNEATAETIAFGLSLPRQRHVEDAPSEKVESPDELLDRLGRVRFDAQFWEGESGVGDWYFEHVASGS